MLSSATISHVSSEVFQNKLHLQQLLDNQRTILNSVPSQHTSELPSLTSNNQAKAKNFQGDQPLSVDKIVTKNALGNLRKRGIVLINEDFDVPPEPGIKQGWSDGEYNNSTKSDLEIMSKEEGSGDEEFSSTKTSQSTTPEPVSSTKTTPSTTTEQFSSTRIIKKTTPEELQISTDNKVSSTTDDPDIEGSGEISVHYTPISLATEEPTEVDDIIKICLRLTCDSEDLNLSPGISTKVPEGTNLTLSCTAVNASKQSMLKLYKYNDSDNLLLQESDKEQKLNFDIPLSQQQHSGTYVCLKLTQGSCCHQQLDIKVYEIPNYKYHLIIIGLVAAISLFTCMLLGIHRRIKTKNYDVQMELQNMEKPVLF
ncbi:uncharacterized protein CDAR_115771 [Caerostris darwini]|uniref:Ig-like domain-containing protein n=1 Tax=Caerostris darwini TaxID=1538125 RepID=A0AAV4PQP5_9ARAC|nr:uncharacterized protein CDAR_115771 [Caerostris darwini]